jgi:phospholipid/cholesterol/gamma-HCH transport system substrate-binding protein
MKRAIKNHMRDFVAIAVLFLIGIGVSGYILSNQRLHLPAWVPVVGQDFYEVKAEFWTAQAVTPGQGQTVNIAGVAVGEISRVELRGGVAVVGLKIRQEHAPIYKDARMLLRPKTGLKDMIVELDPGTPEAGALADGESIPIENTAPDVNLDEILAALDSDTRDYLQILVNGGGEALGGKDVPADLRETLKRFEPTNRDLARATSLLRERRRNLKRVVHNFALLTEELGTRDDQLTQLVTSANANFRALANQDDNIREALGLLPPTLRTARETLTSANRFAGQLGPTSQSLRPFARELGPTLRQTRPFLRETTPVIENQLRPFARDVRPTVRQLRRAAEGLAPVTPRLTRVFTVLNSLLNTLAFDPPGDEDSYLYWASWVNHAGATVFGTQDAHGPIRRGMVITSCNSAALLETITSENPQLDVLYQLLNAPTSEQICPRQTPPGVPTEPSPTAKEKSGQGAEGSGQEGLPASPTPPKPVEPEPTDQPAPAAEETP